MQPVLEIFSADDFALWPVGEHESHGYLVLDGELTPAQVGTAVMRIADCNDFEPEEGHGPSPTDPLGAFLHGLLTMTDLFAAGGFRVTDSPVIELPVDRVRALVTGAQQDLRDFLSLAGIWAGRHLPTHGAAVTAALARALDLGPTP
ncbi:hypothetical protein GCM10010343_68510 [Streptomyces avidinii]|nr:hypothetical protein GCM10010343_68510 [Streptomyces avidinii]